MEEICLKDGTCNEELIKNILELDEEKAKKYLNYLIKNAILNSYIGIDDLLIYSKVKDSVEDENDYYSEGEENEERLTNEEIRNGIKKVKYEKLLEIKNSLMKGDIEVFNNLIFNDKITEITVINTSGFNFEDFGYGINIKVPYDNNYNTQDLIMIDRKCLGDCLYNKQLNNYRKVEIIDKYMWNINKGKFNIINNEGIRYKDLVRSIMSTIGSRFDTMEDEFSGVKDIIIEPKNKDTYSIILYIEYYNERIYCGC